MAEQSFKINAAQEINLICEIMPITEAQWVILQRRQVDEFAPESLKTDAEQVVTETQAPFWKELFVSQNTHYW